MSLKYDHFSFDLDGTILNTENIMREAWQKTAKEFNIALGFDEYKRKIGLPFENIMESLGISDKFGEISKFYFYEASQRIDEAEIYPNILNFIDYLRENKSLVSIITSKPRENTNNLIKLFDINVDAVVCADDCKNGKPTTSPLLYARSLLSIDRSVNEIYFGDMLSDFVFTINCGIDYCHYNSGIGGRLSQYIYPSPKSIDLWDDKKLFDWITK